MISHALLLISALALAFVWWIARNHKDHIMITIHASANDIERALNELHQLATSGNSASARHAGQFLLALWHGDLYPLNVREFQYLEPAQMRQALQLFSFLMTTGTDLKKFMSEEAIDQVADNLSAIGCDTFTKKLREHRHGAQAPRPAAPPAPAFRTLP